MDDKVLKKLVEDELAWEPSIDAADVAVTVEKGIVTLDGHVGTYAQKINAEATVKRVRGVRGFVDRLEILPFGAKYGSDEDIADRVAKVIEWDVTVPKDAVKIQVAEGHVTLTGQVDWQYQRFAAEQAVRKLYGIRGVSNQIKLKAREHTDAGSPAKAYEQMLAAFLRLDPEAAAQIHDHVGRWAWGANRRRRRACSAG